MQLDIVDLVYSDKVTCRLVLWELYLMLLSLGKALQDVTYCGGVESTVSVCWFSDTCATVFRCQLPYLDLRLM